MKIFDLTLIGDAFKFAIKKSYEHVGSILKTIFIAIIIQICIALCFAFPIFGAILVVQAIFSGQYEFSSAVVITGFIASFVSAVWISVGWLRWYLLMYNDKKLSPEAFFLSSALFGKVCILLPFMIPSWFSSALFFTFYKLFYLKLNVAVAVPNIYILYIIGAISIIAVLFWSITGKLFLLNIIEGKTIRNAVKNAIHLTKTKLITVFVYEVTIVAMTIVVGLMESKLPSRFIALSIVYYLASVISPASLVYIYKQLQITRSTKV